MSKVHCTQSTCDITIKLKWLRARKTCEFSPGATEFVKKLHKMKFESHTYQANLGIDRQDYYILLDSLFIKSMYCAYFHEINFGMVDKRREKERAIITFRNMMLA